VYTYLGIVRDRVSVFASSSPHFSTDGRRGLEGLFPFPFLIVMCRLRRGLHDSRCMGMDAKGGKDKKFNAKKSSSVSYCGYVRKSILILLAFPSNICITVQDGDVVE
jgi:hypothetical protein